MRRILLRVVRTQQTELLPLFNSTQQAYAALMDGTGDCFEASCGTGAALAMCTPLPSLRLTETIAMSDMTMEEKIRARAYELWQQDGCLEGCADEYWHKARALVEKEMAVHDAAETGDAGAPASD